MNTYIKIKKTRKSIQKLRNNFKTFRVNKRYITQIKKEIKYELFNKKNQNTKLKKNKEVPGIPKNVIRVQK